MDLKKLLSRIKKFDFERELLNIVSLNDSVALNLNRDDQLFADGIDSTGNALTPGYSLFTKIIKDSVGQPSDRVTLRDTEAFHNSFFLDPSKFPVRIDATDSKKSELVSKYGEDIFGLTDESQEKFNKRILSDVQNAVKKAVGIL